MITISKEDYLKEIYKIAIDNDSNVSTANLAEKLSVTNAATSDMAKKLANAGYIIYEKYKGIRLTTRGKKEALKIIRRHRLWESFLIETLGLNWGEVHEEAEKLEHQTSDFLIDKIDEYLDYPQFDPHGEPIPTKLGRIPKLPENTNLSEATIGKTYEIIKVHQSNKDLMEYLSTIGLEIGAKVNLIKRYSFDNTIELKVNNSNYNLSDKISKKFL
jgi:DtxR family Mn-dependent transcriptional regulator